MLRELLRLLQPLTITGDAYGLIFEYFMGEFASAFMQNRPPSHAPCGAPAPLRATVLRQLFLSGRLMVESAPGCGKS